MLLLDTSVIVAFYIPEAHSDRVQRLYSSRTILAISPLSEVEFASAVSRLVRMRNINGGDGRRVWNAFQSHVQQKLYAFSPMTQQVYELAREWISSFQTALRTLDALQLAAAHANDLPFVTADKKLAKAARGLGVSVERL
ncbi:MAG: type II toxin-antitoxin system VapC family toxin [Phycisphaeraceae bacterium]|nr:type II toxin-antitoxin system VapC family toxin [Phycisphaeraceae bacterium]